MSKTHLFHDSIVIGSLSPLELPTIAEIIFG